MIVSTVRIIIPPEKHQDALRIFKLIAMSAKNQPGSIECRIYRDIEESNAFILQERWESEEHLTLYARSATFHTVMLTMEMSPSHPEVRFDTISGSTGFEAIKKMRGDIGKGKSVATGDARSP